MKRTILFALLFLICSAVSAQDPKPGLTSTDLEKHTYYFTISDNKLVGPGGKFLTDELTKSQYVLLGEYHGSTRISEFTKAIVPILHDAGCRTFGLEIGPVSAEILSDLSSDPEKTVANLTKFNAAYSVVDKGDTFTPIPFFSNEADAEFLREARKRNWRLIGLDQEFAFGYLPLIERMYEHLNRKKRTELQTLYTRVRELIKTFYDEDIKNGKSQYEAILDSKEVNEFLDAAALGNARNKEIADAIRYTTDVYYMNDRTIRKYYDANSSRIGYMKRNLARGFDRLRFDLKNDKMLLKMGGHHTGRGFSNLSLFEIGNTLSELAEFHGNRSLHVVFGTRFFMNRGTQMDALADTKSFAYRYQALLQMARKDQWTVIDLRPLRESVFYRRQFSLDSLVLEEFESQDLYIVPPTE